MPDNGIGTAAPVTQEPMDLLRQAMRFRVARQAVLSGNIAHADTPGYRRQELSFQGHLDQAAGQVARTQEGHITPEGSGSSGDYKLTTGPRGTRPDGNGVELDNELVQLNRNAGAFQNQAAVLARLHNLRRIAITGQ